MKLMKFKDYWTTLPSRKDHCCDCNNCHDRDDGCPAALKRYCMVCKEKAIIGYVLEDEDRPEKLNHSGSVPFWVCDNHNEDPDLEEFLRKGIELDKVNWNTRMGYILLNEYQMPEEYRNGEVFDKK